MQLLIDGVPNNVPLEVLYVCQPPNEAPLVPTRVVQVRPDVFNVPVILEFPVMLKPPIVTINPPEKLAPPVDTIKPPELNVKFPLIDDAPVTLIPLVEVMPLHERDFVLLNDIFVLIPSLNANRGEDAETL